MTKSAEGDQNFELRPEIAGEGVLEGVETASDIFGVQYDRHTAS